MPEVPEISGLHIGATLYSRHDPDRGTDTFGGRRGPQRPVFARPTLDITEQFTKASSYLAEAQLVKDDAFTLYESVATLEIMDPKMDSGCELSGGDIDPDVFDPLAYRSPSEIVAIVDQLLCHFMAWLAGYPLSQTVLTSLHLHKLLIHEKKPLAAIQIQRIHSTPPQPDNPLVTKILRACLLAVVKCCGSGIETVLAGHFYEEEDFATQTFNIDLLSGVEFSQIIELLGEAQNMVSGLLSAEPTETLDSRLSFMRAIVHAFSTVDSGLYMSVDSAPQVENAWNSVAALLPQLSATHNDPDMVTTCTRAFTHRVQKYLASNTPPRPMVQLSWTNAMDQLRVICAEVAEVVHSFYRLWPSPSPNAIELLVWSFSSRKPSPNPYSRSLVQQMLFDNDSALETPHSGIVEGDLRALLLAGHDLVGPELGACEISTDPRFKLARSVQEYVDSALPTYINITRMICQNRCRVRRLLSQSIATWDHLQAVSEDHDSGMYGLFQEAKLDPGFQVAGADFYPFGAWAFYHKLRVMEWVLQLGFELEVYQVDEFANIMTMLSYFAKLRVEHLDNIMLLLHTRRDDLSNGAKHESRLLELEDARHYVAVQANDAQITASLSGALGMLYSLCNEIGLIPKPERPYSSDELRHEMRFKHFLTIGTPRMLGHSDLHAATHFKPGLELERVFSTIDSELKAAKAAIIQRKQVDPAIGRLRGCEEIWNKTTQTLLQCAIAAGLALTKVKDGCRLATVTELPIDAQRFNAVLRVDVPAPEQQYHAWWPVPKVIGR